MGKFLVLFSVVLLVSVQARLRWALQVHLVTNHTYDSACKQESVITYY